MHYWDHGDGGSCDTERDADSVERERARKRAPEEAVSKHIYQLWQEVEPVAIPTEKLAAIAQRDEWQAAHESLKQFRAAVAAEIAAHEVDARASTRVRAHHDDASTKLDESDAILEGTSE